ncbi:MAG: hypothetical protein J0J01_26270 [Reyranella sp.]|uniref:hypothetical protein n=1 Tax=Reyranella sp. TaxID=1929291 RepID=UPI001AC12488|nr:hypothetical protein [Reyranella sp.]MBN9090433.1 hypothetical protein [Reyranella sp.]
MPAFFVIAAVAGAVALGSSAASVGAKSNNAHRQAPADRPTAALMAPDFDSGAYASVADCLTAAARVHVDLGSCTSGTQ